MSNIPIITIDGLSSSGKTTISILLSKKLKWYLLDSGILYRSLAYLMHSQSIDIQSEKEIHKLITNFRLSTTDEPNIFKAIYKDQDISDYLNSEEVGKNASKISKILFVRELLLPIQRSCVKNPGLIANGRDMGTKVFPHAALKFFFIADVEMKCGHNVFYILTYCLEMEAFQDQLDNYKKNKQQGIGLGSKQLGV